MFVPVECAEGHLQTAATLSAPCLFLSLEKNTYVACAFTDGGEHFKLPTKKKKEEVSSFLIKNITEQGIRMSSS